MESSSSSLIKNFFCDVFGIETKEEKALREQNSPEPKEQLKPATDEEKKAKERKWKDLTEEVKFVCQGGKIQCKYCNPPIAEMLPTSTQVMLQDKPYMTANDKDGKINFNFIEVCTHPSQQKPFSSPPPCKTVINLGVWKDYSETMIDDYNALLVKSKIPCMISGEDLEIIHSGQMAELTQVKPPIKREPQIIESYWINEDGEKIEKTTPNIYATLVIRTKDYRPKDVITVTLPVNGEEKEFATRINRQGIAILKHIDVHQKGLTKKEPRIIEAYWRNENGERINDTLINENSTLLVRTEGYEPKEEIVVYLKRENNIQLDEHRIVDVDTVDEALKVCPESINLQALRVIVGQKRIIQLEATIGSYRQFVVDTKETVLFNFQAPTRINDFQSLIDSFKGSLDELNQYKENLISCGITDQVVVNGDFGKTLRPADQQEPFPGGTISTSENFEVYINPVSTIEIEKVQNIGHELFGHLYFYLIGKDPRHLGMSGGLYENKELEQFILARELESRANYEN